MAKGTGTVITHKDVLSYFAGVSPEMAELVLDLVKQRLAENVAKHQQLVSRLAKARKAKGHKAPVAAVAAADPNVQAEVAADLPINRRAEAQRARRQREQGGQEQAENAQMAVSAD